MKRSPSPLPATNTGARPRLWWCLVVLLTSLLGMLAGPGLALLGMGFANATASGTGMALFLVSLWTVLGWRGLHRNRTITYYGLSLAWIWMLARLVSDFPATASSLIMVLFFWPLLTLPLGLAWLCGVLLTVPRIWWRAIALWRHRFDAGEPHTASPSTSQWISVTVKLSLLVIAAFGATQLVWLDRGTKIQRLARDYPVQHATQTNQPIWGACTMVFLGYQLTDHGAASAKSPEKAESICASNLADATAELDSIKAAGGRFVRLGASGDQLLTPKPLQEKVDDQFLEKIRSSGMQLVLVDTQHPKAAVSCDHSPTQRF